MKLTKVFFASLAFAAVLEAQTITIAAAANLKYALADISKVFTKETGITVKVTTGASGKLTQQIKSGAPFDLFMSADKEYPSKLAAEGYTTTPATVYAYGKLVLWSDTGADLSKGVAAVTNPSVKKIAIASPRTAPYGVEAMNALKFYKLDTKVADKIISAESINQAAIYVTTKVVDIGFMAKSVVLSPDMKNVGKWVEVDPKAYNKIEQAMVGLKNGSPENQIAAKKFMRFLNTPEIREIFAANGYILPEVK